MIPAVMRLPAALTLFLLCALPQADAQTAPTAVVEAAPTLQAPTLAPFLARYEARYRAKAAGDAILRLVRLDPPQWRVDLGIEGRKGMAGVLGLNVQQSTVFDALDDRGYRPLSQSTVRKSLLLGRTSTGVYDWARANAQWRGDLKKRHRAPVALQAGDMSGLLINLAIVCDARPGAVLRYRFVEGGRVREHLYQAADAPETVEVGELSYSALRVARTNGGNDDTIVWVAEGVPTPVRILQREDGEDAVDLRLVGYE
jgi:Protein of unknown function (DUF3108)